ncbi:MAG: type II toxin-antitoxin system RelE/ParE family toxin [Pseudomonas sp.]|nr:type II toxin-antitoxin system RelE/ParE family toxin [Pseudomonas sp.]
MSDTTRFNILFTDDAVDDLEQLYDYIDQRDVDGKADYVLDKLESCVAELAQNPQRGAFPPELIDLGIREFREIFFKPYRILYRILGEAVYILVIADGRRDMETLLLRRLLRH